MLIDLRIKATLLAIFIILMGISLFSNNIGSAVFFMIPTVIMIMLVNMEIQTKGAADRIRSMISGMGHSPAETEELTWRVVGILKEQDRKIPKTYSKEWHSLKKQ